MGRSKIAAALELGSSKIAVLVGEITSKKTLNIIGMSEVVSHGIAKGEIYDFKAASVSAHEALATAEKSAGTSLNEIFLGISGGHLKGFLNEATVTVAASNSIVAAADVERVCREAKSKQLPQERIYLHHIHNGYELDGRAVVNPIGAQGQKLSVAYCSVHANTHKVRDAIHIVNGFGLTVEDIVISSLASGIMVSSEAERQNGLLVIDLGAGTSDYALYRRGFAAVTGCLPVGSGHISNDLSLGLRIPVKNAETLKLEFGKAILEEADERETVWLIGDKTIGDRTVSCRALVTIIEARLREVFTLIHKDLAMRAQQSQRLCPAGVVITGAGSFLPRIDRLAADVFGVPARLGENPRWVRDELRGPGFSTVLGLMHYAVKDRAQAVASRTTSHPWLKPMARWLGIQRRGN